MVKEGSSEPDEIKRKAEERLKGEILKTKGQLSESEILKFFHEDKVYQIELELQYDELRHAWAMAEVANEKYAELFDFAPIGFMMLSIDGVINEINQFGATLLGKDRSRLKNASIGFFITDDTRPIFNRFLEKVFSHRAKETCEVTLVAHDKSVKYVYLYGIPAASGDHCIVTMVDLTDRRRIENELRESEEKYRRFFERATYGIFQSTPEGKAISVNPAFAGMFGYESPEEFLINIKNVSRDIFANPNRREEIILLMKENPELKSFENVYKRKDGSTFIGTLNLIPVHDAQGILIQLEGFIEDITARKQYDEDLHRLNFALEERVAERTSRLETMNKELGFYIREIEQFTYIVSHDLQEPLLTLANFTKLLMQEYSGKLDEDGNRYVEFISQSAGRMSELLKGLLLFSLLGKDRKKELVDCNKIVGEVLAELDVQIKERRASIDIQNLPTIEGSAYELELLFLNLLSNAIKFTHRDVSPEIVVSFENGSKDWIFHISDNGIGIQEKDFEKIFVIFKRLHNRSEYDGVGIGLALCKKIVELHAGTIRVENAPGTGSVFSFTIPKL